MKELKITYIFPSRSRSNKFFETLGNIIGMSVKPDYEIICSLDLDDFSMNNNAIKERLAKYEKVTAYWGYSKNKVEAINRECDKIPEDTDIVILMSDDMVFMIKGFDDIIRTDMQKYFPDLDGILHYPDGTEVQRRVITMSIMGYAYFKRFNFLYHPEYTSLWCDMETTVVAQKLGKYKDLPALQIFKHDHPLWKKQPYDELMKRNESFYDSDKAIYFQRLAKNFDL